MKRLHQVLGLGALAAVLFTPLMFETPVMAQLQQVGQTVAQNLQRQPQMQLQLSADKQVVTTDAQGQPVVNWEQLNGETTVHPGDVLRYSLNGQNTSDRAVRNLVLTQPIPRQMQYVLESAAVADRADTKITYSIDGGNTFVANPTIEITLPDGKAETRPTPAEAYTHIRWDFGNEISAGTVLDATYQTQVR